MPLARILTLNPEQVNDFAQQFYDLGFEVEVVSPHEQSLGPADLEIEFAICDQQQILARAAAIATQLQAEVVVFPKAIPPLPKPIPITANLDREFAELQPEEGRRGSEGRMEASPEAEHILEYEDQPAVLNQKVDAVPEPATRTPSALQQLARSFREGISHLGPKLVHGMARMRTALSAMAGAVANRTRALREGFKLRLAQARADRDRRLVEIRQRQAEAAQQAAVIEQEHQREMQLAAAEHERLHEEEATLAATMQQQEIMRLKGENDKLIAEVERLRTESKEQLAALELARHTAEEQQRQTQQQPSLVATPEPVKAAPGKARQLRGALAGAVAASALFLAGMLLANFQSVAPLSRDLSDGSVEQEVPFGPTTVHGAPGVTVGGPTAVKPTPATSAPQPQAPVQAQPQPVKSNPDTAKPSPEWRHFRRSSSDSQDNVNDGVVVRHFRQPSPATQTAQQRAGIKRYSDE